LINGVRLRSTQRGGAIHLVARLVLLPEQACYAALPPAMGLCEETERNAA
jgi:hypothetical protein